MTDDLSNKTLATLLVAAIVVSLGGTWLVLNTEYGATGFSTDATSGTAQVTVTGTASLTIVDNLIDFSNGSVTADSAYCEMTSGYNGTTGLRGNCTWVVVSDQFVVENTGNANLSIDIKSDLNETVWLGKSGAETFYAVAWNTSDVVSCVSGGINDTWTELNTSDGLVCTNMGYGLDDSALQVDLNITIPTGTEPGQKNVTVTFTGTSI